MAKHKIPLSYFQLFQRYRLRWITGFITILFLQISISSDLNEKKITETYTYTAPSEKYYLWTTNTDIDGNFLPLVIDFI